MAEAEASGPERAAIFLLSLGEQEAAQVLKHMEPGEVQKVGAAMAALKNVSREQMQGALLNFIKSADTKACADGHPGLPAPRAHDLGRQAARRHVPAENPAGRSAAAAGGGIEALKWMEPKMVAQAIGCEHPQIVAIVLAQLDPEQAGKVIELLPEALRSDVLLRIATLDEVPQNALAELDQLVEKHAGATPPAAAAPGCRRKDRRRHLQSHRKNPERTAAGERPCRRTRTCIRRSRT